MHGYSQIYHTRTLPHLPTIPPTHSLPHSHLNTHILTNPPSLLPSLTCTHTYTHTSRCFGIEERRSHLGAQEVAGRLCLEQGQRETDLVPRRDPQDQTGCNRWKGFIWCKYWECALWIVRSHDDDYRCSVCCAIFLIIQCHYTVTDTVFIIYFFTFLYFSSSYPLF